MPQEPTYLGTVEDVRGASISVALAKETASGLTFISGVAYRIGQVGRSRLGGWDRGREPGDYQQVVEAWRLQQPRLPQPKKKTANP